jgi:hypothetical protein
MFTISSSAARRVPTLRVATIARTLWSLTPFASGANQLDTLLVDPAYSGTKPTSIIKKPDIRIQGAPIEFCVSNREMIPTRGAAHYLFAGCRDEQRVSWQRPAQNEYLKSPVAD